jgi:hypothetical protein
MKTLLVCGAFVGGLASLSYAAERGCKELGGANVDDVYGFQAQNAVKSFVCNNDRDDKAVPKALGWMDRPDRVSEVARANHVFNCIGPMKKDAYEREVSAYMNNFVDCIYDAKRLDRAKVEAELKALELKADLFKEAMQRFDNTKKLADEYFTVAQAKAKAGSAAAKMILEVTEKAAQDWQALYDANKARFELAYGVEKKIMAIPLDDRLNKQHKIGCEDLRTSLREYAAAKKPKTKAEIKAALTDPVSYVMLSRLGLCDSLEGRYADGAIAGALLKAFPYQSGPRNYARLQMRRAVAAVSNWPDWTVGDRSGDVEAQDIKALDWTWRDRMEDPYVADDDGTDPTKQGGSIIMARVATVKKLADGVALTFKKEKWTQPVQECTSTGKVNQWSFSGAPIYQYNCKITGTQNMELQHAPDTVTVASGSLVKANQMVRMAQCGKKRSDDKFIETVVVEVLDTPKGKKDPVTTSFFGIPVSK